MKPKYALKDGYVPDAQTAAAIAELVCSNFYGKELVVSERPFKVRLQGDVWIVDGTLPSGLLGGALHIEISKSDGRILSMTHFQ